MSLGTGEINGRATWFAPAERASTEDVARSARAVASEPIAALLLNAMPIPTVVLNGQRQVVAANRRMTELLGAEQELLGRRPGELFGCVHADEGPNGCGTSTACRECGLVDSVLAALAGGGTSEREARLVVAQEADGGALDVLVRTSVMAIGGQDLAVVALQDISAEKRRKVLERIFFHDVTNTAGGIRGLAEFLVSDETEEAVVHEFQQDIYRLSEQLMDEIAAQRQLLAAEKGELPVEWEEARVPDLVESVLTYRHHPVADQRTLRLGALDGGTVVTDVTLLRRVLGNLVKNALESIPRGAAVTVSAERRSETVEFRVHNPGVMSDAVQHQIFQRSFSTKGGSGRGIGTYSVRLLTERYLGGTVSFISRDPDGTIFTVSLPLRPMHLN